MHRLPLTPLPFLHHHHQEETTTNFRGGGCYCPHSSKLPDNTDRHRKQRANACLVITGARCSVILLEHDDDGSSINFRRE